MEMPDRKAKRLVKRRYGNTAEFSFKEVISAFICFVACGVLFAGLVLRYVHTSVEARRRRLEFFVASSYSNEIRRTLEHTLSAAYAAAELVYSKNTEPEAFRAAVQRLIPRYPHVLSVELAPDGIIEQVEPLAGHEKAVGLNLLEYQGHKEEAEAARKSGKLALLGPYTLVQGFPALIGMLPVFTEGAATVDETGGNEKRFWGFVSIVIDSGGMVSSLHESGLCARGYNYELLKSSDDGANFITVARTKRAVKSPVESKFEVANTKWIFKIEPAAGWLNVRGIVRVTTVLCITDILIFISALLFQNFVSYNRRLENAISFDSLTGAYTRQAGILLLDYEIKKARRNETKLMLCFIDMNDFKHINDTYGHRTGDLLLQKAVEYMKNSIRATDVIARFGGDEFLVILNDQNTSRSNEDVIERLKKAMTGAVITEDGRRVDFSASIGTAVFPDNGKNRSALIEYADKAMYEAKQSQKTPSRTHAEGKNAVGIAYGRDKRAAQKIR